MVWSVRSDGARCPVAQAEIYFCQLRILPDVVPVVAHRGGDRRAGVSLVGKSKPPDYRRCSGPGSFTSVVEIASGEAFAPKSSKKIDSSRYLNEIKESQHGAKNAPEPPSAAAGFIRESRLCQFKMSCPIAATKLDSSPRRSSNILNLSPGFEKHLCRVGQFYTCQ